MQETHDRRTCVSNLCLVQSVAFSSNRYSWSVPEVSYARIPPRHAVLAALPPVAPMRPRSCGLYHRQGWQSHQDWVPRRSLGTSRKDQAARGYIQAFRERVRIDAVLAGSEAVEDAIGRQADEVDAGWWDANGDRFLAGTSGTERPE
jgi:hypothetical protein